MSAIAAIHVGKKHLAMDDTAYRAMLQRVTGQSSLRAMSEAQRRDVVREMRRLGFRPAPGVRKPAGKPFQRKIHALWRSCAERGVIENGSREALRAFCRNRTGVADPDWLTWAQAAPLIEALKQMEKREKSSDQHTG